MKVKCQSCGARFKIQDSKVPDQGMVMNCPKCSAEMTITKDGAASVADAPEVGPGADAAMTPPPAAFDDAAQTDFGGDLPDMPDFGEDAPADDAFGDGADDFDFSADLGLDAAGDETPAVPDEPQFGEIDLGGDEDAALTAFDAPPDFPAEDDSSAISDSLGLDDDFSLDDALADLDDESDGGLSQGAPPVPDAGELESELSFDDLLGDGLSDTTAPAAPADRGDDFSLDMPGMLESAAEESQQWGEAQLPDLEAAPEQQDFPDAGFSFDDMLGDDDMTAGPGDLQGLDETAMDLPEVDAPDFGPADTQNDFLGDLPDLSADEEKVIMYQIQRKSGKTFGPFPQDTVLQMIADGKLVGSEQVRIGEGNWLPITEVDPFSDKLQGAMGETALDAFMPTGDDKKANLGAEREKIKEELQKRRRTGSLDVVSPMRQKRFGVRPIVAIPLVVVLLAAAAVAYLHFTEQISIFGEDPNRPLIEQLKTRHKRLYDSAEQEMARDNYQGYVQAREILLNMLKVKDFKGAGAVWALLAQADYQILRRYGVSKELVKEAEQTMQEIDKLQRNDLGIRFAKAAQLMYQRKYTEAKDVLVNNILMQGYPNNRRALHWAAETYLYLPSPETAMKYLERVISANQASAQTYYLQGSLYNLMGDTAKAKQAFSKALELDPEHLDSQIELAGILLREDGGLARAERELITIRNTFKDKMSRKQLARVHYYFGLIYMARNEQYKVVKELGAAIDNEPDNYLYNMTLAQFHFEKHEFDKAAEQFTLCLANNNIAIQCHLGLGRTQLTLGHPDQTLFKLEDAAKVAPQNAEVFYLLGLAYEKLFKPAKALEMYEKAISLDPNGVEYYTSAAMSHLRQDRIAKAGEYIQKAKLIKANSPLVHNFLGQMHLHQGDVEKAIEEFDLAIQADPEFIDAHVHLADTYRQREEYEKAIVEYQKVLNLDDRFDQAYFGLARTYFAESELDKAITEYEKALNLNNRSAEYYYWAGVAYYQKKELDKALEVLKKAAELDPAAGGAPFYMGRIFMDKGNWEKSAEQLERSLTIDPKNAEYTFYMALLFEKQEKLGDAIDFYESAIVLDNKLAAAYLRKGIVLRAQNKFLPAIRMFRKAQQLDPTISMAHSELGDCYFEMRKYDDAVKQFQKVIDMAPEQAEAYRKLGLVYQEMGKTKEAVRYFKRAIELDADDAQAHLGLGYAYKRLRQRPQAVASFEKYLELAPTAIDRQEVEDEIFYLKNR